jgi:hypothetical protein
MKRQTRDDLSKEIMVLVGWVETKDTKFFAVCQ